MAEIAPVALPYHASVQDFIDLADSIDDYMFIEAATDYDLGWYYVHELGMFSDYPEEVLNYFDYEAYGRDISFGLTATKNGYYAG